jgi:serine O-acetyltransferase
MRFVSIDRARLPGYVAAQLGNFFPLNADESKNDADCLDEAIPKTLSRLEKCFLPINDPFYSDGKSVSFDVLHSDQYAAFLCLLGNQVHQSKPHHSLAKRVFLLNKALHGLNCMYDVELPSVFWLIHVVGAVIGKARYADRLVVRQGCTVGAVRGEYPVFDGPFIMSAHSSVIGASRVGANVMLGPGTSVFASDLPAGSLVCGHYAHGLTQRPLNNSALNAHFRISE